MSQAGTAHSHPPMPLAAARERIVAGLSPIEETETVALADAHRRVLAHDVVARVNVPSATNSSMDGYALCVSDDSSSERFEQVGQSLAGHPFDGRLEPGQCVRITTGAVVPAGADRIVIQENVTTHQSSVTVENGVPAAGANIRPAGEDIAEGETVLHAGRYLRPADIAVLASVGQANVAVMRRLRVAFFSTGDELRPIDGPLASGEIYDSNRYGLAAMIEELGLESVNLGAIGDDPAALAAAFDRARDCDALITTGGVSVGDADHVVEVLKTRGEIDFWKVAIKPGKPLAVGRLGQTHFFGLPGNPVSTAVTFIQLVRPALVRLAGGRPAAALRWSLPTAQALDKRPGREHYLRARIQMDDHGTQVSTLAHQGSGVMQSMSLANAFVVLAAETESVGAGEPVTVEPFAQPIWD